MSNVIVKNIRYFETRRGLGYEVKTNQGTIWNDGQGGETYVDDWKGKDYSEDELENILDEYEGVDEATLIHTGKVAQVLRHESIVKEIAEEDKTDEVI